MPLAKMLGLIAAMCPVDMSITAISDMMTTAEKAIAAMVGVPTTEDGMADIGGGDASGADCGDITVIFARGTTEAGNVGVIAGPPFFNEIERRLGNGKTLVVQGVDYPANVAGFLAGGDRQGSQTMYVKSKTERPGSDLQTSG